MVVSPVMRKLVPPAGALVLLGLAGCSGTTYGTGIAPEQQTIKDVMSLASLGSNEPPPIDYRPRGGIVAPPTNSLPPPGSEANVNLPPPKEKAATATAANEDPNWPKDPDEQQRQKAEAEAKAAADSPIPNFILPKGQTSYSVASAESTPESKAQGQQAWDALHKGKAGSTDANGVPVRKYLTEPPVDYREPDPNQPMTAPPKKPFKLDLSKLWPF